jgi:hypothetical protein
MINGVPGAERVPVITESFPNGRVWRGWLWISLIIAIFASMAYRIVKADESPPISDLYSLKSSAPDRRGTTQQPLVIEEPPADLEHARNEREMARSTIGLAIVTALLFVANLWLIFESKRVSTRQALDTREAIREASRSADAMQSVAETTRANAALMSSLLTKQMRAYIVVNIGLAEAQKNKARFASYPEITNTGLTPAKNITYRVMAAVLDLPVLPSHEFPEPEKVFVNDATLSSHGVFKIAAIVDKEFSQSDIEEISKGEKKRLFSWGSVTYEDVFGEHHETKFCRNYSRPNVPARSSQRLTI